MLKVALFGLGGVAERIHLPALNRLTDLELAAACEIDPARGEAMRRRFRIPRLYHDPAELIDREKPDIVVIGTPPGSHHELCLLALNRGAHVFCEKPFVRTVEEADEIVRTAEQCGRYVAVNNQYRFMSMYQVAKARIDAGEFGRPFLLQCWEQMFHPPSAESNWRADLVESTLFEFGTHALDLICFLFADLPLSVVAEIPRPRPEFRADVVTVLMLRFSEERVATVVLNRISHAAERYLEMRLDCERASLRLSLGGVARASLDWSKPLGRPIVRWSLVRGGETRVEAKGRSKVIARERRTAFVSAAAANLSQFARGIASGTASHEPLRYARELIRLVSAAYESAHTGQPVALGHAVLKG